MRAFGAGSQSSGLVSTNVCMKCIGQSVKFVCSSRTHKCVRLAHTNFTDCPLQFTQHYLCETRPLNWLPAPKARMGAEPGSDKGRRVGMGEILSLVNNG